MSTNATSADPAASLSVSTDVLTETFIPAEPPASHRNEQLRRQLISADVIAGSLTGAIAALAAGLSVAQLPLVALAIGLGWPVLAYVCGLYALDDLRSWASGIGDAPRLAVTSLLLSWPVFGLLTALDAGAPVLGALAATLAMGAGAGLGRAAVRAGLHRAPGLRERTLILGSGDVALQLVQRLKRHTELGLDPVGYIDDDVRKPGELGIPRLGTLEALRDLIAFGRVDRVMIAFTRASHEELLHCIRVCRDAGVTVDIVPRLFEFLEGARTIESVGGMPLLSIRQPTFSPLSRVSKRALDIVGALFGIVLLSPLLALIAVAIKLDSKGPVFFAQQRSGRRGRFFKLYKFRSMRVDSTVLVREDGAIVKAADDARITRVGRIIRRFSLDEAPQLLNVLRGDMSLVGPRPLVLAEHAALNEDWQSRRADLRPGLTGPWQVSGRSHIPFQDMIKFDYQYVAGWSLARDVEILLATIPAVLTGRGAY
ncbi:MAG TPA: sugar transferase [Solirubrobacter sp.]|nr:sugar transferase [Solirubrobacter sp.]